MEYKNQHFVTEAYLKAWCDPETPEGYEPYVWIVSKKARLAKRKSPKKIFSETDYYTIRDSEGNRNVEFEKGLQKIESSFIALLRNKIDHHMQLGGGEIVVVSTFVATMFARVKKQRDQEREMWQELINDIDNIPEGILGALKGTETYDQINNLRNQPLPYSIVNFTNIAVPFFSRMSCEIFETETKPGFITSDNPCFMIDPAIYTSNPPRSWFELFRSPTFEVLFPVSPNQLISLKPKGQDRYFPIDILPTATEAIEGINQLIVGNSEEFIVVNQKEFKETWFENT